MSNLTKEESAMVELYYDRLVGIHCSDIHGCEFQFSGDHRVCCKGCEFLLPEDTVDDLILGAAAVLPPVLLERVKKEIETRKAGQ